MPPLFLLLLAAGAVAVIAASAKKEEVKPDTGPKPYDGQIERDTSRFSIVKKEKFMDPLYLVYGGKQPYTIAEPPRPNLSMGLPYLLNRYSMDAQQPSVIIGYEYLKDAPNEAAFRVGLMRARIKERLIKPPSDKTSTLLEAFVGVSRDQLATIAENLSKSFEKISSDASAASKVAAQLGISSDALVAQAKDILSSSKDYQLLSKTVEKYGPTAKAIVGGVTKAIEIGSGGGEIETATKVFDAAAEAAMLIPAYGPFISAGINVMGGMLKGELEKNKDVCRTYQDMIAASLTSQVGTQKYPIPLHALQIFSMDCGEDYSDTEDQRSLVNLLKNSLDRFKALPAPVRVPIIKWWGLALTYMGDPRVEEVFRTLGFDASGGVVASDEQVMMVAAPIAVAYGLPVDTFAADLWAKAKGWRGVATEIAVEQRSFCPEAEGGCTIPVNGWWLQWADLAKTAFALAESWPRAVAGGKPISLDGIAADLAAFEAGYKPPKLPF